jgi:RNA polymerase sigma-70 factor (ECF subfamily)
MTGRDEKELVLAAQRGDARAFEDLVRENLRHVRTFVALRAPVSQLVDEVTHETFVHAHQHLADFQAGTNLRAWLRAIAFQKLRGEIQRYAREQANQLRYAEQVAVEEELAAPAIDRAGPEAEALQACMDRIEGEHRDLLQLKYRDELESDAIAAALNRSTAWVRTTLFRIREVLRDCIEEKLTRPAVGNAP